MQTAPTSLPPLVASDVDGTLLRSDRSVSARTRRVLDEVVAAGARLVYVTGRPPRWLPPVVEETGHRGTAICANGALVLDLDEDRVVSTSPFDPETIEEVVARLRTEVPGILLGVEWADGFAHEAEFSRGAARAGGDARQPDPIIADDEGMVERPVLKLLARHTGRDDVGPAVEEAVGDHATVTWSTDQGLVEVSAPGVDKAAALARLAAQDGLGANDAIAFGDMPNDVALLAWVGWGVAMGQAHDDVLAVADEVTASNDEDGVAAVLERLLAR